MDNIKQLVNLLRIINNSSEPLRTDKDFTKSDEQLIRQLLDEDYITGKWEYSKTFPIKDIRQTIKS
ncbi:MAG: hypothetical protein K8F52_16825 [Candidatus Scalindua rubra]|uniref:Uncharacterized protein n=1 Tax=Candidatus Scalindua brodae TaxID=237368 RepID=A0A0B0EPY1_9BACT|nr:MAG: hypothetical protein SCABRO_00333 [Candidatus Scalindua brodae]MBZ0110315.1 hypothetical protein [Candidatus Scalindua rubra]